MVNLKKKIVKSVDEAVAFAQGIGFPVWLSSAYSLGWHEQANNMRQLRSFVAKGLRLSLMNEVQMEYWVSGSTRTLDSDLRQMTPSELRQEAMRLRQEIFRWATTYWGNGNKRCHEVDERLARVIGSSLYPGRSKKTNDGNAVSLLLRSVCRP